MRRDQDDRERVGTASIPGLLYGPQESFPAERLLELSYATWEWIKLDNAKTNLADETYQHFANLWDAARCRSLA